MQDLIIGIRENVKKLRDAIESRNQTAINRAKAEYKYRSSLGRAMAEAKMDGMAATALYDYCRGLDEIARLRANRDILESQENYYTELIYYYRTEIRIAEGMMNAERKGM